MLIRAGVDVKAAGRKHKNPPDGSRRSSQDFPHSHPDSSRPSSPTHSSAAASGEIYSMKPLPLLLLLSCVLLSSHLRPAAGRPPPFPGSLRGQHPDRNLELQDRGFPGLLRRRLLPPEEEEEEDEDEDQDLRIADLLLKRREEPPLSIDLTFHLLRNMIQMARTESQRERAQLNRKVLDEVGK
ncbi:unnamed protein product [Menidia menidia]|uniref:(Atlantic silverside) hypothetical protein n=1 Tax=Menidia menidia TaxID=238744 RepID=A0A8S4B2H8_9TELE|nr:unnamed protein product [Menidia menidia]